MYSGEKECIQFDEPVNPHDKGVEFWMGELEEMMFKSIRTVLLKSVENYKEIERPEWMLNHPGQCVLNGSQIHWTTEVEEAMEQNKLAEYVQFLNVQISETVKKVQEEVTKLQSITIGALITIDVHAKEVVQDLADLNVTDITAFDWISQLRYYWMNKNCFVKCIQTVFPYGYEYLGNTFRLVITALTDQCYMTLMGALRLNLGGAP